MFWWVTVPVPTSGSHMEIALWMSRPGSRYRYSLVSAETMPGRLKSSGM